MEVGDLHETIDQLLAVDATTLTNASLHDNVIELQAVTAKLAALRANRVEAWSRRKLWASDGSTCASARLSSEANLSPSAARDEIRRAHALAEMQATAAALGSGMISLDHVDRLAHANAAGREPDFARDEDLLVEDCVDLHFDDSAQVIDYWQQHADEAGAATVAQRRHQRRGVSWRTDRDGSRILRATLEPVAAAAVDEALHRVERRLYLDDRHSGNPRTGRQRGADALVAIALQSAITPAGRQPAKPLISILVGEATFAEVCELAGGTVLTTGEIIPLLDETDIERIIFDAPDQPVAVSEQRCFTGALRRAIEIRDRHCTHPSGCRVPAARADIDHIIPDSKGGETSVDNGRVRCHPHNRDADMRNATPRPPRRQRQPADPDDISISDQIELARQRARLLTRRD